MMTTKQKQHSTMWQYEYDYEGDEVEVEILDLPDNIQNEFKRIFQDATNLDELSFISS
jgi:hypothetical protein